jgi:hypothetical protein
MSKPKAPKGNVFFMREGALMAQPFDNDNLKLRGEPVPLVENVGIYQLVGTFSVSTTRVLAYRSGVAAAQDQTVSGF